MQALFSRAARNPGTCRCIQCVSNTTAVARRPTVGALKGAWAYGTPTSTFVYTAVFAAGLTVDARAKQRRNENWDTAFALLREAAREEDVMEEPGEETRAADVSAQDVLAEESIHGNNSHLLLEEVLARGVGWDAIQQASGNELLEEHSFPAHGSGLDLDHIDDLWELLAADSRFPGTQAIPWLANTGQNLVRHRLPPQSLWSHDHAREKALRRRQVRKKIVIQELSMGMLIRSLIAYARSYPSSDGMLADISPGLQEIATYKAEEFAQERREMNRAIECLEALPQNCTDDAVWALQAGLPSFTKPEYAQDNDGDFYHVCAEMNASIKELFSKGQSEPAQTLAKIAHNLLISTAPPDVQTFNILISTFKRWKLPSLIDETIKALDKCKIRPNEITCATILDYYIQAGQPENFSRFVAKMRGVGNALMMAVPDITINEAGAARLVRVNDAKVYQKVYPTPLVFNTLMLGVLRFAGIDRALEIYYEMKEDGWGLDVLGLSYFLLDCVHRADWENGLFVWEEINSIKKGVRDSQLGKAYSEMLSLCSVTGNTAAFNHILKEVIKRGMNRKEILDSAMAITRRARSRQPKSMADQGITAAPAWAADNVLIAVSGYMDETVAAQSTKRLGTEEEANIPAPSYEDTFSSEQGESKPVDPDAAWSAWMEHEFGANPQPEPESNASQSHQPLDANPPVRRVDSYGPLEDINRPNRSSAKTVSESSYASEPTPHDPDTNHGSSKGEDAEVDDPDYEIEDDPQFCFLKSNGPKKSSNVAGNSIAEKKSGF